MLSKERLEKIRQGARIPNNAFTGGAVEALLDHIEQQATENRRLEAERDAMESMLCLPCTVIPCRAERAFVKDKNCHQRWQDFFAERAARAKASEQGGETGGEKA